MHATKIEETALSTTAEQQTAGLVSAAAKEQHEIQSAIIIAKKMPRNEDAAFQRLMKAAARTSFAEDAAYRFPRGLKEDGTKNFVEGPSVNIAREAARVWGNMRYGLDVIEDTTESRTIRGWAWDLESNTKVAADDKFEKLIQRKQKGGGTTWVAPDERDLRELTNRRGAILVRNCILQILPKDLIEDAMEMCAKTLTSTAEKDPDLARKRVLAVFAEVNVTLEMLEAKLGHALIQCTPKQLAELRQVGVSIRDGHSTWKQYLGESEPKDEAKDEEKRKAELADIQAKLAEQREKETSGNGKPAETRPAAADPGVEGAAATPVSAADDAPPSDLETLVADYKAELRKADKGDLVTIINEVMKHAALNADQKTELQKVFKERMELLNPTAKGKK